MSKSIFVIDTPSRCVDCVAFVVCSLEYGILYGEELKAKSKPNKKVCRLKPMPERIEILDSRMKTAIGWNECLDEIIGEEE